LITFNLNYNIYFCLLASYSDSLYLIVSEILLALLSISMSQYSLKFAHDKHGEIGCIAAETLSYIIPQVWTDIYDHKPNSKERPNFPKDPLFYNGMLLSKEPKVQALSSARLHGDSLIVRFVNRNL
jgi:hypothetical protein